MDGPEIPPFFICPISLQIMKDPVTVSTGMTYDRESIQKWLFCYNRKTCPATKQPLTDQSLTPNSTLLRLIQSWSVGNASMLAKAVAETPKPTFDATLLRKLFDEVRQPESQLKSLRKIKSLIQENDDNRTFMEEAGVASIMASLITKTDPHVSFLHLSDNPSTIEEATNVLCLLKPSSETLKKISEDKNGKIIEPLSSILQRGSFQARIQAALLLKSIFKVVKEIYKTDLPADLFDGVIEILKDQNSNRATVAVLSILLEVMPFGKNRIKAVEAGAMAVLVELLAETNERRICEIMLTVLELLCGKAEGRSAFLAHPAGIATVASKLLRVSHSANDRAVKVLLMVCRFCMSGGLVQEMLEVGGVAKLCMVVQVECTRKTKEKAMEILGFHLRSWTKSPCFPSQFI